MCQQLYSYLKRDESAINRLLITPIESNSDLSSAQVALNK